RSARSGGKTMGPRALLLFAFLAGANAFAQAPDGIPRALAQFRAQQLTDIRYRLSYTITPRADSIAGHEELRFVQGATDGGVLPEWLDFREGSISRLTINGQNAATAIQNRHLER